MPNYSQKDVSERQVYPMVRFKRLKGKGPQQDPILNSIHDSLPTEVVYASPIYLLESDQRAELDSMAESPYAVSGSCIADELQNRCQRSGMVLYPIFVECDALTTGGNGTDPETVLAWIRDFIEEELGVPPAECTYYHSGGRSIHAHVPRVGLDRDMERLRQRARDFNERYEATLDAGIYSRKRQFRLSGAPHFRTGIKKSGIGVKATAAEIAKCINDNNSAAPKTYAEELALTFEWTPPETLTLSSGETVEDAAVKLLGPDALLRLPESEVTLTIAEEPYPPGGEEASRTWHQYNEKEFSPYANAGEGNSRSVAVVTIRGSPFSRIENKRILVPCEIHAAVSCDGKFNVENDNRPLQVSKRDLQRWTFIDGDRLVVIGGRSRKSKILEVTTEQALTVTLQLIMANEGQRRESTLQYLIEEGFDTGKEGAESGGAAYSTPSPSKTGQKTVTEAKKLQKKAERDGIQTLDHNEHRRVAQSLLVRNGWERTWTWFVDRYGDAHDPNIQYTQQKSAADNLNSRFGHSISIPPKHECV